MAVDALDEISAVLTAAALDAIDRGNEQITSASLDQCGYIRPRDRRHPTTLTLT